MASKSASLIFGRMNPPTREGHAKGIQQVLDHAEKTGGTPYVFVSHSHDNKKNPVHPDLKASAIKHEFPEANVQTTNKESPSVIHILKNLNKKHNEIHLFAGSDRTEEYHNLLHKYNNKEYNYKKIVIHSIGQRDPDGESSEGSITSGTAARQAAMADPKRFHAGVLGTPGHKDEMIRQIRAAAMAKTSKNLREQFINNEIFNLHDYVVNKKGQYGEIVYKNSNYVTIQLENNETVKSWIYEIEQTEFRLKRSTSQQPIKEKIDGPRYTFHFKQKAMEQKIPALLRPTKAMMEQCSQIKFEDYTSKNFDACPKAYVHMKKVIARKDLNPKYVKQAIMALDKMFAIEKEAAVKKSATSEEIHDFSMYASVAHDTLNLLGYQDRDIVYIQDHYVIFSKLIGHHDYSLSDEPGSHTVTGHIGDIDEWADPEQNRFVQAGRARPGMFKKITTADYETRTDSGGKKYKVKKSIISKGHKMIDKDGKDNEPSGVPPFAGLSGMYENEMKTRKESYDTAIQNTTFDPTKPDTKTGVLPFGEFLKLSQNVPVKRAPLEGDTETPPEPKASKSMHAKTAGKRIQMGLD